MEILNLPATAQTPSIDFDPITGTMEINGRSIPDVPDDFWMPVLNWFETYVHAPAARTVIKIRLEYFNISSSKRILFLLYKLNELAEKGNEVSVEWIYREEDEDMYEVGQDYAYMVKVPFKFKSFQEPELMLA